MSNDAEERTQLLALARAQTIAPQVLERIEKVLKHPKQLLDTIERQERFLVTQFLAQQDCPWCDSAVGYFEAVPAEQAETFEIGRGEVNHVCPQCKKRIVYGLPFMGPWRWRKHEEDKNPDRRKARARS